MKHPKVAEAISSFRPNMECPSCKEGQLESNTGYELKAKNYVGEEIYLIVHALVCDQCDYASLSSGTALEVAKEKMRPVGTSVLNNQGFEDRVLN